LVDSKRTHPTSSKPQTFLLILINANDTAELEKVFLSNETDVLPPLSLQPQRLSHSRPYISLPSEPQTQPHPPGQAQHIMKHNWEASKIDRWQRKHPISSDQKTSSVPLTHCVPIPA
jgi:hypothetical protein